MRIVVGGDAVRVHFDHGVQRLLETCDCLQRQAVHQVHVDGLESEFACLRGNLLRQFPALLAINRFLYLGIDILYAEADAIESSFAQYLQLVGIN